MEYTKDLILNIRYAEVGVKFKIERKKWTSNFLKKMKKNKTILFSIAGLLIFILIDSLLLINFIRIMEIL